MNQEIRDTQLERDKARRELENASKRIEKNDEVV